MDVVTVERDDVADTDSILGSMPTVTWLNHRPIFGHGDKNGWGMALYSAYEAATEEYRIKNVRIVSAPPGTQSPNTFDRDQRITHHIVDVENPDIFSKSAKPVAIDVHAWDLMHVIRPQGEDPLVVNSFLTKRSEYEEAWRSFFVYSINAATTALSLAYDDEYPIFHLNDMHDSFVSALFAGNYNREWLLKFIGDDGARMLRDFEGIRGAFEDRHGEIRHMRFWHTPSMDPSSWQKWYEQDPMVASHFLSGIVSSPLNVHSPAWKVEFTNLFAFALPEVAQTLGVSFDDLNNGIGVGPIGYAPEVFLKRFTKFDPNGEVAKTLLTLNSWAGQIRKSVGDEDPVVVFLTCRGDDPKNNLVNTIRGLTELARQDPDVAKRLVTVCVYQTSRKDALYKDYLDALDDAITEYREVVGELRLIESKNAPDLSQQTAGFILANAFICAARGGFDVVGAEASIVAATRSMREIDPQFAEVLEKYGLDGNQFHLVMAESAGSSPYLSTVVPAFSFIHSPDTKLPEVEHILVGLKDAWSSLVQGRSELDSDSASQVLSGVKEICSGAACIDQWVDSAISRRPESHPRTIKCMQIKSGVEVGIEGRSFEPIPQSGQ